MFDLQRVYISRKRGNGMSMRYRLSSLLPLLVLTLVTSAMVFALSFIFSMSERIDRMIAILGSGSVYAIEDPYQYVPEDAEVSAVRRGSALIYTEGGVGSLLVKGVDENYFSGMRGRELDISFSGDEGINPVVISFSLASDLGLSIGDRFTMLLWDSDGNRARPYLCTVGAVFSSVYPQLDSHLAFADISLLSSVTGYEILLPPGEDPDGILDLLWENGIAAETYRTMYSSLYLNVRSSIGILYIILASVALLAAFFSSDAAQYYISRDRNDIYELWLLGAERGTIRAIYFRLTISAVAFAAFAGTAIGICLAYLSPFILHIVSLSEPSLLEYYVTSFSVRLPAAAIAVMIVLSILVSALSISVSLRKRNGIELF